MNREILFRGKRINNDKGMWVDNGDWVEGFYFHRSSQHYIKMPHIRNGVDVLTDYEVDPATVGQYTGLKDKNGVMIFDGDVVRDKSGNVGEVRYSDHFKRLNIHFTAGREDLVQERELGTHIFCWTFPNMHLLVISNIHDATPQGEG